jgi:type IV pilus assembly protein PilM
MSFFSTKEKAFGLDISDQTLRLVQFNVRGNKSVITAYNEITLPTGCIVKGEIKQASVFLSSLEKLIKTRHGKGRLSQEAIVVLPESESFMKNLAIETDDEAGLPEKIKEMLPQNLPLDVEEIYWDWQEVQKVKNLHRIIVGASPKVIIDDYLKIISQAGITPVVLEIEASAISRLLLDHDKSKEPQIIIDIGLSRTGLFLYDGDAVQFTVSLPISGRQIDEVIAQSLDLDMAKAEEAKIVCGLDKTKCEGAILQILAPTIEDLASQILNAVNFYYENFPNAKEIKKLTLSGGGANMVGIAQTLAKATEIATEKSNPFKNIANPNPKFFTLEKSQSFITALGLGLRGIKPETFYDKS